MSAVQGCGSAAAEGGREGPAREVGRRRGAALAGLLAAAIVLPALPAFAGHGSIEDPSGRASLQVSFRQQPTYQDLAETEASLTRMASILCDATEGQVRIAQIHLMCSPASEDLAALWFHDSDAASGGPYDAGGGDLRRLGAHMDVFSSARLRPDRLAHLLAHHAFGLGDQYDDQRRRGGACGIGPGFDAGTLDERNHSLMQGAGAMHCSDGALFGQDCTRDDECAGANCEAVLASEFSIPSNHDRLRGDGGACPRPSPVSRVRLGGLLSAKAEPVTPFDGKDFLSARATSVWHKEMEVLGPSAALPGIRLQFYLTHTARLSWQLSVAADAAEFGGSKGRFQLLKVWTLLFNEDFSLAVAQPGEMRFELPSSLGKGPVEVAIDVGTRNPDAGQHSGQGYDGLQMIGGGAVNVDLGVDGVVGCSADWCASSWNQATSRWELSEQSLLHHGASDWTTLTTNLPFLVAPLGGVTEQAPASCRTPPEFLADVMGADQVVFVLDTSRTMGTRVDGGRGEVCANGVDDDGDGETDEADCADSRLEYERVGVRAFLAIADSRDLQVGVLAMSTDTEVLGGVEDVSGARRAALGATLGSMEAEGDTAMGTALEKAQDALVKVQRVARSRSVLLVSDGANNIGVAPGQEARRLDPLLYRVFTVGIGSAADEMTLSAIAARSGGVAYQSASATGTPAILAELAARRAGDALLMARTPFDLAWAGEPGARGAASSRDFDLPVEEKAGELVVYLGSRNDRIDDWKVMFELEAPDGERIDDKDAQNHSERGFDVLKIQDPKPGLWKLRVLPAGRGVVRSEVLAYTALDNADLFVDADPRLASVKRSVRLFARPSYVADIDGDVTIDGTVRRPDGSIENVKLTRDPLTREWGSDFDRFAGRGLYEVRLHLHVGEESWPALGEPIFPGPSRMLLRVVPFERTATTSFYVADGPERTCTETDCDGDGLSDRVELAAGCKEDADGDGIPNRFDADSDNDEILDGEEGAGDIDKNGIPDFCDREATPVSLLGAIEADETSSAGACGNDAGAGRDSLKASLAAVRRIEQAVRVRDGVPADVRSDILEKLDKVIALKKQAIVIGEVLPDFCQKYQERLGQALALERELRVRVDPYLAR